MLLCCQYFIMLTIFVVDNITLCWQHFCVANIISCWQHSIVVVSKYLQFLVGTAFRPYTDKRVNDLTRQADGHFRHQKREGLNAPP